MDIRNFGVSENTIDSMTAILKARSIQAFLVSKPTPKPKKNKSKSKPTQKRNKPSKYEELVQSYLEQLTEGVLRGDREQSEVENLTPLVIATAIQSAFKAKISSVQQSVRKTEAWNNRKKTFKPIYDTKTFRNRKNTNSPFQKVQECGDDKDE